MKKANYLQEVRNQYENYPYPPRNPEDEKKSFKYLHACALDNLNHYNFSGKRDFSKNFRTLIAGGGTGDSTIMMAEQLKGFNADIVHLDISQASIEIAQNRAKVRGLDNITWIHGSLLDAKKILKGKFDHINCIGVLHHLESPEEGLAALNSVLKDNGVMEIMLYAKYGREGVYQIQNLMRILNQNENNMQSKIDNCKSILKDLPLTSGFQAIHHLFAEMKTHGDVGIYDLLLHSNDVAYSVPDIYKFLSGSNLKLTHFFFDQYHEKGRDLYKLESYIQDKNMKKLVSKLSLEDRQAAAELMYGKIIKHHFYASKKETPIPTINDLDNIPSLSMVLGSSAYKEIYNITKAFSVGQDIICKAHNLEVRFKKTANTESIFNSMDGYKTLKDIFKEVRESHSKNNKKPTNAELKKEFEAIFLAFSLQDWMFLRDKSVPRVKTFDEIVRQFGVISPK